MLSMWHGAPLRSNLALTRGFWYMFPLSVIHGRYCEDRLQSCAFLYGYTHDFVGRVWGEGVTCKYKYNVLLELKTSLEA